MLFHVALLVFAGTANAKFKGSSKVVGGAVVREDAAPYMAAILYCEDELYGCGGAIIHQNFVLTAGHCIRESEAEAKDLKILVGTNNIKKRSYLHRVDKLIVHERYSIPYLPHNDIALVRVDKSFEFNKKVQPINFSRNEIPEDSILRLTGYGQSGTYEENYGILRAIDVRRISLKVCNPRTDPLVYGKGHLCTFNEFAEQGICYGDSASPLTYKSELVAFAVSFGGSTDKCADGVPDVHVKISFFYDWIKGKVKENTQDL